MARYRRCYSRTGYYHVVLKRYNKQEMFHDDQDRNVFLSKIEKAKEKGKFEIIAYCLMDNHVHLVFKEGERIGKSFQRFPVSYAAYYHKKYGTSGHFFANRYFTDVVEDEVYLMNVIRYVHQNPIRAGMVKVCSDYKWSSYNRIFSGYSSQRSEAVMNTVKIVFPSRKQFYQLHQVSEDWYTMDREVKYRRLMKAYLSQRNISFEDMQNDISLRNRIISHFFTDMGISQKEIGKFLGISTRTVQRTL